jgi:exopolysaccharide biosynthesis protein
VIPLPLLLAPPAPFPLVVAQWSAPEDVAPGIRRTDYRLTTSAGPLVVHVVAIDTHDPNVRLGTVVARDHLISSGETVSSMAARTGAVAGINADYFDIGNTNQPLNVVVRDGTLLRTPSKRVALEVDTGGDVTIGAMTFAGSVAYGNAQVPLTGVNEWPPQGGAALLTPAYGSLAAMPNVVAAALAPVDPPIAGAPGTYRVTAVGAPPPGPVSGLLLGFGPAAQAIAPVPNPGDALTLAFDTTPSTSTLRTAVGGGPLLVANGAPAVDPNSPAPEETNVRFPVSGAALEPDGTLLLIVADGRNPATSIGLTRPEFGALMRGFGTVDGMAFDSGGSATLVTRELGTATASVVNDPSDGRERPVADALLAYSTAPNGVHPHLVVRPATFIAYRGAEVALRGAIVDDADHVLRAATVAPLQTGAQLGPHLATVREIGGTLTAEVPYRTVDRVATLTIVPDRPNPARGVLLPLTVTGADERGAPVVLGTAPVRWMFGAQPQSGTNVVYDTHGGDVTVTASLAGATATTLIRVGDHTVTVPAYPETALTYDFTGAARAAYANTAIALPDEPVRLSVEVLGDGNGVPLRASFVNRYGEKALLTLAKSVDWTGWRRVAIALPPDLNPPVRLTSIYVVRSLGGPPVSAAGTLRFRALAVVIPGSS